MEHLTVTELIELLREYPDDMKVNLGIACLLSSPCTGVVEQRYHPGSGKEPFNTVTIKCDVSDKAWYKGEK